MQMAIENMGSGLALQGISMEEQFATLGMLQGTLKGEKAGTALAAIEKSAFKAQEAFDNAGLGIEVLGEDGKMRSIADLLADMESELGSDFTAETTDILQKAFGSEEAVKVFKNLWGQQDKLRENTKGLAKASNQAEESIIAIAKAADKDNGDALLQKHIQRWGVVSEKFGKLMIPMLEVVTPIAEKLASWMEELAESGNSFAKFGIGIVGAIAILGTAVAPVVTSLASMAIATSYARKKLAEFGIALDRNSGGGGGGGYGGGSGGKRRKKYGKGWRGIAQRGKDMLGGSWSDRKGRGRGILNKVKGFGGRIAGVGSILSAMSIGSTLMDDSLTMGQKVKESAAGVASIGGGIGGAAMGAAIGTMIFPGVGTAIGGLLGGWLGSEGGDKLARGISSWFEDDDGETVKKGISKVGAASAGIAMVASTAGAADPVKSTPTIQDSSQTTITLTIQAAPGMDEEQIGKVATDALELKLRELRREQQIEKDSRLYGTD